MNNEADSVKQYGRVLGWELRARTVLVEGTTDVELLDLASRLNKETTGVDLFKDELTVVAAGRQNRGGTKGVVRELISLRAYSYTTMLSSGKPKYRFIGLVDNDGAGRKAIKLARDIDSSILEYKDIFRLHPVMPVSGNLDPKTLQKTFEKANDDYKAIDWELEDMLPQDFIDTFCNEYPAALRSRQVANGKCHHEFSPDGKAEFHRFIRANAVLEDLQEVVNLLHALRFYLNLPSH